ncbi:hypothetical protein ALP94_02502 [Pseudomonas savastanoi pv. glycinea]|nr:hypothetical protein ALP94_02502 [Pseudomonas savastanoi pv. glycinea]
MRRKKGPEALKDSACVGAGETSQQSANMYQVSESG